MMEMKKTQKKKKRLGSSKRMSRIEATKKDAAAILQNQKSTTPTIPRKSAQNKPQHSTKFKYQTFKESRSRLKIKRNFLNLRARRTSSKVRDSMENNTLSTSASSGRRRPRYEPLDDSFASSRMERATEYYRLNTLQSKPEKAHTTRNMQKGASASQVVGQKVEEISRSSDHLKFNNLRESLNEDGFSEYSLNQEALKTNSIISGGDDVSELRQSQTGSSVMMRGTGMSYEGPGNDFEALRAKSFLELAGLGRFVKIMFENGFDCMETLVEVTDEHLVGMGVPIGFRIKLKKKISEFLKNSATGRKDDGGGDEEGLEAWDEASGGEEGGEGRQKLNNFIENQKSEKSTKMTKNRIVGSTAAQDLNSRLPKLKEAPKDPSNTKKVHFAADQNSVKHIPARQPKSPHRHIWGTGGHPQSAVTQKTKHSTSTASSTTTEATTTMTQTRVACYHCYTVVGEDEVVQNLEFAGDRKFCSNRCLKLFLLNNSVLCAHKDCMKPCNKLDCVIEGGRFYCNQECADKDVGVREEEMKALGPDFDGLKGVGEEEVLEGDLGEEVFGGAEDEDGEIDLTFDDVF